jgi:hypothetical protein
VSGLPDQRVPLGDAPAIAQMMAEDYVYVGPG